MARLWRTGFGWFLLALGVMFLVWAAASVVRRDTATGLLLALAAAAFLLFGAARLYYTRVTRED